MVLPSGEHFGVKMMIINWPIEKFIDYSFSLSIDFCFVLSPLEKDSFVKLD